MTDTSNGFLLSATLHGFVVAVLLLLAYAMRHAVPERPKVFELVAGGGDNFMAREAPALGTPAGVAVDVPAPAPIVPSAPAEPVAPDFEKQIRWEIIRAESAAKMQLARERAAERKRIAAEARQRAAEKRRQAEAAKRMTKEEFDAKNRARATPVKTLPPKVSKIDAAGIAQGVVGGSTANRIGGAGGQALVSTNEDVLAAYFAHFKVKLKAEFETPPGQSDTLVAVVRLQSNADGSLTGARIIQSSGSPDFDQAVLDAIRRVRMPPRPDQRSEPIKFPFTMRERG